MDNKKKILKLTICILFLIGIIFLTYPFIISLGLNPKIKNDSIVLIDVPVLRQGELKVIEINGINLFILKPNNEQLKSIHDLNAHVWNANINSFNKELGAYVYWGYSTKWGCPLELKPSEPSMLTDYKSNAKWFGGYWDFICEVSYDYSGRAIKTYEYTYNGYDRELPNLKSPTIFRKSGEKYAVSIHQR